MLFLEDTLKSSSSTLHDARAEWQKADCLMSVVCGSYSAKLNEFLLPLLLLCLLVTVHASRMSPSEGRGLSSQCME